MNFKREMETATFQAGATIVRLFNISKLHYLQNPENAQKDFYKSVFMEYIIELDYLFRLSMFKDIVKSINFTDDIPSFNKPYVGKYKDIISLIHFVRNTICHAEQYGKRRNDSTEQYFAYTFRTYADYVSPYQGYQQCPYPDDIAALFGEHIIFINRHIMRVYYQFAKQVLELPEFAAYKKLIELKHFPEISSRSFPRT